MVVAVFVVAPISWAMWYISKAATTGAAGAATAAAGTDAATAVGSEIVMMAAVPIIVPIIVGADGKSWDCWRPILHDYESPATRGRPLTELAANPRVVEVRADSQEGYMPQYWLKNKWEEEFRIDYVQFSGGEIAAHATRI